TSDGPTTEIPVIDGHPHGQRLSEDTELLKHVAAHVGTLVAGGAAIILEKLVALLLFLGNRGIVSAQIAVEGSGSYQRSLEGGQSIQNIFPIGALPIGFFKKRPVNLACPKAGQQ